MTLIKVMIKTSTSKQLFHPPSNIISKLLYGKTWWAPFQLVYKILQKKRLKKIKLSVAS